ncbi:phosphoribosylformylglycinamidine synthase subunit PurL [Reyranella sp. CPCC 100927]|uniref:phosphoribosylformylglycinamidine synthase subunit PurL n=1 Tax=Reyranella sp. CPCC 100927 TaxID=2599616 RepID=UPI0011B7DF28|nr:phosphoribosylformylglycinamidine synthase subunit PurL [Reyranella sp. CPCC 100927]TWS97557.1 phosphoribosylformylglycinamidine synthase subunit PurL [Reyranella sp. CPCC 100927]
MTAWEQNPPVKLPNEPAITPQIVAEHGLAPDEYERLLRIMGREPTMVELGIFSAMWSEHCSYKSSKVWLKKLPTEAPWVIQGPGENAGVIDIGDGQAAIFKMESHNHPSYIEPYQGAATGVGGIMRDVFTMGARPIANVNALRFGDPTHPKTRHLVGGVVAGIGGYGNCMGIPTVAGETSFHRAYNENCLVNAMTVGIARTDRIFYAAAAGLGNPVVYVGSKTGRDGIHGATMASTEFTEDSESKRPTVQVGDPFVEKLLLEACLELMATDAIVAIQDMGAAGLTSSSFEMADKGELGLEIALDKVPMRETGMNPYELMLSESQERMLMVLKPGREDQARRIFEKWELDFAVIGHLTDTRRMVLRWHGDVVANIPIPPVVTEAPVYERPWTATPLPPALDAAGIAAPKDYAAALLQLVGSPDQCSKAWVWRQYDHLIMGNTAIRPGGDAAVVRVPDGNGKALAITSDCTPRYCQAHPETGGRQAVAEAWRNLTAVGATPLACTDNMNFGNPQKPEIMGQFAGCTMGMAEACTALAFPIVSGNVSLYNETQGRGILPTPVIGGVGVMKDVTACVDIALREDGLALILVGETRGHLGQSIYLRDVLGREDGPPPPVDLAVEKRNGDFVRAQIGAGRLAACHDLSDGGLALALAEMAMAGGTGATVSLPRNAAAPAHALLFGEDQARYVMAVRPAAVDAVLKDAAAAGVPVTRLGTSGGAALTVEGLLAISVADLRRTHESWLPAYMEARS